MIPFWYHNLWILNKKDIKNSFGIGLALEI
jgi:hypothetical protein